MAATRRAKASGRASASISWVNVAVGSRLDTTTGAVATSPSPKVTPLTAPSSTTMPETFT